MDTTTFYGAIHDLYEVLHPDREAERAFYRRLVQVPRQTALDVACGTGVISSELIKAGAIVTGLDVSSHMLEVSRRKLPSGRWLLGDMRNFDLQTQFDLVVCACNSLQHTNTYSEALEALKCMKRHLAWRAQLIFDVFNPSQEFLAAPRRNVLMRSFKTPSDEPVHLVEDTDFDPVTSLLHIEWRVVDLTQQLVLRRARSTMQQFYPACLDKIVADAGLRIVDKFGDFNGSAFFGDALKQVVVVEVVP